jgi:transposase
LANLSASRPIAYLDESGVDRYLSRQYARSLRGKGVTIARPGRRYKRVNVVAAQCGNEIIAPYVYDWSTNALWFETWFEWYLCPNLKAKSVIVMDNAKFHRKTALSKIAAFYGLSVLWLPPYSPDKNPIEHLWANMKNHIRNNPNTALPLQDNVRAYFNL